MKLISWLIGLPVAVLAILFAVVNRHAVPVGLWPLPFEMSLPLYILVLGALAIGLVCGGVIAWFSAGHVRSKARKESKRARVLEYEVQSLRSKSQETPVESQPEALPKA